MDEKEILIEKAVEALHRINLLSGYEVISMNTLNSIFCRYVDRYNPPLWPNQSLSSSKEITKTNVISIFKNNITAKDKQ